MNSRSLIISTLLCGVYSVTTGAAADTAFTYQGELKDGGALANGSFNIDIALWDAVAGGNQIGSTAMFNSLPVTDGRFTVELDFGASAFNNAGRWLKIDVNGITLSPRTPITRAPYAIQTRGIFVDANNNVGIGTITPLADLYIDGTGSADLALSLNAPGSSAGAIHFGSPAGSVGLSANANNGHRRDIRFTDGGIGLWTRNSPSMPFAGNGLYIAESGNVGIGTTVPFARLDVRSISGDAIFAHSSGSFGSGVLGESAHSSGIGVEGKALASSGLAHGVRGSSDSSSGTGVHGTAFSSTCTTYGIFGTSLSTSGRGVFGFASAPSGSTRGVFGQADSSSGRGVFGYATSNSGINYGVRGQSDSSSGYDFYAAGAGVNYGSPSSIRWKDNIEPVSDPLGRLAQIRGVFFIWDHEHGGQRDIGFIGEEVGGVLPEVVAYEDDSEFVTGMDYSKMTPLLVEAVNALRAEKDSEITELHTRIAELEQLISNTQELQPSGG